MTLTMPCRRTARGEDPMPIIAMHTTTRSHR